MTKPHPLDLPFAFRCLVLLLGLGLSACRPGEDERANRPAPRAYAPAEHAELGVTPPIAPGSQDQFLDVTESAGIRFVQQFCDTRISNILESNGSGVVVLDYDNDGWMDLFFVNPGPLEGVTQHQPGTKREPNHLYRNRGDGTFENVAAKTGLTGTGYSLAAVAADYDNDGWTDLYVVNVGRNTLYRNRGNGTFQDVTDKAGVGDTGTGIGAVFADIDNDGRLDLFVANYLTYDPNYKLYFNPDGYPGPLSYKPELNVLYRNKGDGTFEDVSQPSGIRLDGHRAMSVSAFDYDADGDQDFYICNDATPNILLVNDGRGRFIELAQKSGVAFNALGEAAGSMVAAIGDYNGDQLLDILVSRLGYGSLYTAKPGATYDDRMMASGLGSITAQYVGWGSNFLDYDNDGDLDAFIANGDAHHLVGWESLLLENRGDGTFHDAVDAGGAYFRTKIRARGSAVLDYDNDGQLDVVVTAMADRAFLLRNRPATPGNWLLLKLIGSRSNRDGFGAQLTARINHRTVQAQSRCQTGFLGNSDPRIHLGLGQATGVNHLEIRWPSGTLQQLTDLKANQIVQIQEPAS